MGAFSEAANASLKITILSKTEKQVSGKLKWKSIN